MNRSRAYKVYKQLTNKEKGQWATELGYKSTIGLRKYLMTDKVDMEERYISTLYKVLDIDKIKTLGLAVDDYVDNCEKELIKAIRACDNIERVEEAKKAVQIACDYKIYESKLASAIK